MPRPSRFLALSCLAVLPLLASAKGDRLTLPPRPWGPDAFLPVTEERIAALPASEQPAWRTYWEASAERAKLLPPRDLVDHTPNQPVPVGTFKGSYSKGVKLGAPAQWYASEEARSVADKVVKWQRPTGGWTKSGDYTRDPAPDDDHHDGWSNGTFDNDATIYELRFLALVQQGAGDDPRAAAWRDSFGRGLGYAFAAQYPNGGFPQIYPLAGGYHDAITYNDDAMVHILELFRDCAGRQKEFAFISPDVAAEAAKRMARGVDCVLATQLRNPHGRLIVWGQQHDALTLKPCAARNFEPISECSSESAGLVRFLMSLPQPSPRIVSAVDGAVVWFKEQALHDVAWDREAATGSGLVPKPGAEIWARYYEPGTGRPIFGDRDRTIHYVVTELSVERRKGYAWFNNRAVDLPAQYAKWKAGLGNSK
jgi:PelA/Pel-15E family pectate lyase